MRRHQIGAVAVLVLAGLLVCHQAGAVVVTLQPGPEGKDTWISEGVNSPRGDWGDLRVGNWGQEGYYHILLQFDLSSIPTGATINSAKLELYRYYGTDSASALEVGAYQVTSDWTEDVTWDSRPNWSETPESTTTIYGNDWYQWDLTSLTQKWVSGAVHNYGVALHDSAMPRWKWFVSSDNTEQDPKLRPKFTVDYDVIPEASTYALFGLGSLGLLFWRRRVR